VKRIVISVLLVLVLIASVDAQTKKLRLGVLWCTMAAPSVKMCSETAITEAARMGVELITLDGQFDVQKQTDQALNLISQKVDGIIINPIDAKSFIPVARQIYNAKIPLVVFVQPLIGAEKYMTAFVGGDDVELGKQYIDKMAQLLNGKGNIVLVEGALGSAPQVIREKAMLDQVKKYPGLKILDKQCTPWDRAKGMAIMEDFLTKYPNIDGVIAWDDNIAMGCVEALKNVGKAGRVKVLGYVGVREAFDYISDGTITATINEPLLDQTKVALRVLADAARGKQVNKYYWDGIDWITKENMDSFTPQY
jgi:ribose transport system substrate-binding protein